MTDESEPAHPPIGIDLGTTYSAIAYIDATGRPSTIANSLGELLTPTAVFVEKQSIVVGSEAAGAAALQPDAYADCFKRDVGSSVYRRDIRGVNIPPEVLNALVLESLKNDAEAKLGSIRDVVITVPAFFDENRRKSVQDAGRLAGLNVVDIINEPTAAAVCYGFQQGLVDQATGEGNGDQPVRVLVYDLGGGTFDVTILEINGNEFRAIATDGDVQLGGKDYDGRIVDYLAEQFITEHGADPRSDPNDAAQLWLDAQKLKHTLSHRESANTVLYHAGIRLRAEISRDTFDEITCDLTERTETTTALVIKASGLSWSDIDRVLLVGGSSRIPSVGAMLERLTGKPVDRSASPDEAIAHGAALYASMLRQADQAQGPSYRLINVNSHSLGVAGVAPDGNRVNAIMIPKNSPLPVRRIGLFETARADQRSVKVTVLEGESNRPEDCIHLGDCVIRDLPAGLPKGTQVEVTYGYASNGTITVTARIPSSRDSAHVEIKRSNLRDLETLDAWKSRLLEGPESQSSDKGALLRQLDELYTKIGNACVRTHVPRELSKTQAAAQKAMATYRAANSKMNDAELKLKQASSTAEQIHAGAEIARTKTHLQQTQSQANFACLILGRQCVNSGVTAKAIEEDIRKAIAIKNALTAQTVGRA